MRCCNCGRSATQWNSNLRKIECQSCHSLEWVDPGALWDDVYPDLPVRAPRWIILCIVIVVVGMALVFVNSQARAAECRPYAQVKELTSKDDVKWIELTPNQFEFIRGIYAMNPLTPPGLPYGDRAVLTQKKGDDGGVILFIDGDAYCTPMPVPKTLLRMLSDVAAGTINHEGNPL